MNKTAWRDLWEQPNLLKDLTLLSLLKNEGPMTAYKASLLVRGTGGGGYCSAMKHYFNQMIERNLISSENMPKDSKRKIYLIAQEGEKFLEKKKQEIASL